MHILTFLWYFATWPVSRNIPVTNLFLQGRDVFTVINNISAIDLVDCLLLVWVARLILPINYYVRLALVCLIIDNMLAENPIVWISVNCVIVHDLTISLTIDADSELNIVSGIGKVMNKINRLVPHFPSLRCINLKCLIVKTSPKMNLVFVARYEWCSPAIGRIQFLLI